MGQIWTHQYSSGESHSNFEFPVDDNPCSWFAPSTSGTVVIVNEGGTVLTYAAVGGEVVRGRFTSLTSNTCTKLLTGNGEPPMPALATAGTSSAASIDTRASTDESATTSAVTRLSTEESKGASAVTRISTEESARTSGVTSAVTRLSTADSVLTSTTVSLQTRLSVAESVEASKG